MKILLVANYLAASHRLAALFSTERNFVNEVAAVEMDLPSSATEFVANESQKTEGWVHLAPYGDWPNAQGLQRFTKDDAVAIVNEFAKLSNLPQRILGLPWYIGHPDHKAFESKYRDQRAYGRIKQLEARDDGLFANVRWSSDGEKLVKDEAFHGHSVNWRVQKRGAVWHPIGLKSVGFTNDPQIPVAPAMANENQPENIMPPWIKESLVTAGLITADATDEQVKAAFMAYMSGQKESQTALANEKSLRTAAESQLTTLSGQVTNLTTAKTTAETSLANERKAHAKSLLDIAEKDGRVKPADRATWETDFANEFTATATKLGAAKATIKTSHYAKDLANRKPVTAARQGEVQQLVNERMTSGKLDYDAAFMAIRKEKPELFERDSVS